MAAGKRTPTQHGRGQSKTPSPRAPVTSPNTRKKALVNDLIEISSTNHESNAIPFGNEEKESISLKNHDRLNESWMRVHVEEIRDVVTNFTHFMMNNAQSQTGYTKLAHGRGTPQTSSLNNPPDSTVDGQTPYTPRVIKSAPSLKISSNDVAAVKVAEDGVHRKLFSEHKEGLAVSYYMNYDTMHTSKTEMRKCGFQLPEWLQLLFKPPPYVILDEVEATVAAYLFGANQDILRKEILIKCSWGCGDRKALKSLMPRAFVD